MNRLILTTTGLFIAALTIAQRVPVLNQIDLPHNYYFRELYLPQLTSGPSAVTWSPDEQQLIYSMQGSLWIQHINQNEATQLTNGNGSDYQPDWSPDGKQVVFVRYNGTSCELMLLDVRTNTTHALTDNKAVNLEPQWSPDGTKIAFVSTQKSGHFLLYMATISNNQLSGIECLTPDTKSQVKRYYYSPYDHAINPTWSADGKHILFISNHEIAHGTGDIVSINIQTKEVIKIHHEETNWRTKPDVSPDGTRMVYSSYLGRNWHQLWLLPIKGGYPIPLTYGEYDNTFPRWSPSGEKIAFISNRKGNTSLWITNVFDGEQKEIKPSQLKYLTPRKKIIILLKDENGNPVPARVSILTAMGNFTHQRIRGFMPMMRGTQINKILKLTTFIQKALLL